MEATEGNKGIVRAFVEAGNSRDFAALETILSSDFVRHCPATPEVVVRSFDDFRRFLEADARTFPDNHVVIADMVAEGDQVAFWGTYSGTQSGPMGPFPASGHRVECEFGGIFRIEGSKIVHLRLTWDNLSILTQLGHFPPPGGGGVVTRATPG